MYQVVDTAGESKPTLFLRLDDANTRATKANAQFDEVDRFVVEEVVE